MLVERERSIYLTAVGELSPGTVFAGHRIDRFAVPWDLVVLAMLLAILTAAGAAWWPARAASRVPVVNALSARPLEPRRPRERTARRFA